MSHAPADARRPLSVSQRSNFMAKKEQKDLKKIQHCSLYLQEEFDLAQAHRGDTDTRVYR